MSNNNNVNPFLGAGEGSFEQNEKSKNGIYYGTNAVSNNMILYNRKPGSNDNSVILGTPGPGKGFFLKREVIKANERSTTDV